MRGKVYAMNDYNPNKNFLEKLMYKTSEAFGGKKDRLYTNPLLYILGAALLYYAFSHGSKKMEKVPGPYTGEGSAYQYAQDVGLEERFSKELKRLGRLDENDKEFIDTIAKLPEEYQKIALTEGGDMNIAANGHISSKELEETKEYARNPSEEGIENPKEVYAVLANGKFGVPKVEYAFGESFSIANILSVYKVLKDRGVPDENITLMVYHPHFDDVVHTRFYKSHNQNYKKLLKFLEDMDIDIDEYTRPLPYSAEVIRALPSSEDEVEVDMENEEVNNPNFLKAVASLNSDKNDVSVIGICSHGDERGIRITLDKYLKPYELAKAVKKMNTKKWCC